MRPILIQDPDRKRGNPWFQQIRAKYQRDEQSNPLLSNPDLLWNALAVIGSIAVCGILILTLAMLAVSR